MKDIFVSDITIRQMKNASGIRMTFKEKLELAKQIEKLGVSVIELEPIENPKADSLLVKMPGTINVWSTEKLGIRSIILLLQQEKPDADHVRLPNSILSHTPAEKFNPAPCIANCLFISRSYGF